MILNEKKKKKDCSSITYTTGDIGANIRHFNKCMRTDFNNPSTEEAKANAAAKKAADNIGTISAASPDSGNSVDTADLSTGEGTGMSEALKEETMYAAKYDAEVELPSHIHIIDKQAIEAELEKLEPEEEFEVGYVTPVYLYKELWDKFILIKCTQLTGYTGIDYIEARANDDANKQTRIDLAKQNIAKGGKDSINLAGHPRANKIGDVSANYDSINKTVKQKTKQNAILQDGYKTLLFYPKVGSRPKVTYYLSFKDKWGFFPVPRDVLEDTLLAKIEDFADSLSTKRWDDVKLRAKIQAQLASDAATIDAVSLDATKNVETRSRISNGELIAKPQVRALYTNQIYYLKTNYATLGKALTEELQETTKLQEAKRYVRRYYIRPQNIFCSNKTEILQTLIQFEDKDCIIYTLNNLGDEKDVTKLTNNDIIYYYQDGILYDKNMLKIMDYDLYIKHEEERDKINPDKVSDATFADVYADRITGSTGMDEAFSLDFADVNVYGETLTEGKAINNICCICGEKIEGYGNNPEPYMTAENGERCCDACNIHYVIPARLEQLEADKED